MERPATSADRSRPPTPRQWEIPTPAPSSSAISCWAPVPDAATRPTGPGRTTLAKPSPTPPTTAVPQSGPITSTPAASARSLRATSRCERHVVAEHHGVQPGVDRVQGVGERELPRGRDQRQGRLRLAGPRRPTVAGAGALPNPVDAGREDSASAASTSAIAGVEGVVGVGLEGDQHLAGARTAGTSNPIPAARSRLSSVAIATSADRTPASAATRLLTCIRLTEST